MNHLFERKIQGNILWIFFALSMMLASCAPQNLTPDPNIVSILSPKPVILDVDMAHEDIFTTLFLLAHPNVDVRAITVAGTGEAHCVPGVTNVLGLLQLSEQHNIPVACGQETPLAGDHAFPNSWRQDADNAYGVALPIADNASASQLSAPALIADILQSSDERMSIVAVGPLTNIAEVIRKAPEIAQKVEMIYIMGGAIEVEGNVGGSGVGIDNKYAEWNIYIDPRAANIVFKSGIPITLVPLDATRDVPVTRRFYNLLGEFRGTPAAELVYDLLTANLGFIDSGGFQFWDSLTAAIFTDESIASFEDLQLTVVVDEGPESGRTRPGGGGDIIKVAVSADQARFEQLLLTILNWNGEVTP